jgi:glutathione peroxidase
MMSEIFTRALMTILGFALVAGASAANASTVKMGAAKMAVSDKNMSYKIGVNSGSAHDFTFNNIEGGKLALADFAGQPILLVNTASMCGFTKQYAALQEVWSEYRDLGLVVIGVPSGDFGGQEYDSAEKTKQFCEVNYGIDFPMTEKVRIKGKDAHPYYRWVASEDAKKMPRWNFHKHLIDADGNLVDWFASTTSPKANRVIRAIEKLLPR